AQSTVPCSSGGCSYNRILCPRTHRVLQLPRWDTEVPRANTHSQLGTGVGVVSVHQAPAQHRPRPGLEVREVGIPPERVRVEPAVPRPRGEAGERQAKAEPGPEDRLAPPLHRLR
ncbi:unnamed protein product, partial [Pylaiella littoralis]